MFDDRTDAGERFAARLLERGVEADVVLGIPRGALPVARPVADALEADLDVVVARKMGAPDNPELAIGAVAADGSVWRNDALVGAPDSLERLGAEADAVIALESPRSFRAVGQFYRDFGQVPDAGAEASLER